MKKANIVLVLFSAILLSTFSTISAGADSVCTFAGSAPLGSNVAQDYGFACTNASYATKYPKLCAYTKSWNTWYRQIYVPTNNAYNRAVNQWLGLNCNKKGELKPTANIATYPKSPVYKPPEPTAPNPPLQ